MKRRILVLAGLQEQSKKPCLRYLLLLVIIFIITAVIAEPGSVAAAQLKAGVAKVNITNKEITGPIREIYINDPREVAEEDILTEIYVPVG